VKHKLQSRGFTLVEILVVLVIMGVVTGAVYTTFLSTQRQAYTQDEVVEVQQNLRAALDYLVKDIRMAQFMAPANNTALVTVPTQLLVDDNSDGDYEDTDERPILSLVSATSMHGYARVTGVAVSGSDLELDVAPNTMQQFADGDVVRVFRPVDLNPVTNVYLVTGAPSGDQVDLDISGGGYTAGDVTSGDLLVSMPAAATDGDFPLQIDYQLVDDPSTDMNMNQLQRRVLDQDGNTVEAFQLIASNISGLALNYLDDTGNTTTDLAEVVAIELTMTARTDATRAANSNFSGPKTRSLSTTVKIHNGVTL
jgi:prepilin-type N-terminal cleavage/methylation domain-containing protein